MTRRLSGTIKWYNHSRGFGVILGIDHEEYFVHSSNIEFKNGKVAEGLEVTFTTRHRSKKGGFEAIQVKENQSERKLNTVIKMLSEGNRHNSLKVNPLQDTTKSSEQNNGIMNGINKPSGPSLNPQSNKQVNEETSTDHWFNSYKNTPPEKVEESRNRTENACTVSVVGVTYEGRQQIIAKLTTGEQVFLIRDPYNPYDRNAIKVERNTGESIGFISRDLAKKLAPKLDLLGSPITANVTEITGGYGRGISLGVRISFSINDNDCTNDLGIDYYKYL